MRLLDGVRILSVEQYGAGPYGTGLLVDLGAEVIKLEQPSGGDISRGVGPFLLSEDDSEFFQTFNRGKKSLTIDLKSAAGQAKLHQLVGSIDAVANNLRGDLPERLGLTYDTLSAHNPSIVCAHLSAYGRDNRRASWPGYDYLMQAECGFLDLTGEPNGPPARFGLSMVDYMTGTMLALALVSAVMHARQHGQGCDVDTSLYDTALHQLSYPATWYLNHGHQTRRLPRSSHPSIMPSQLFPSADGWLFVMCQTPRFWQRFCELLEQPQWLSDSRFVDTAARRAHQADLQDCIDAVLRKQTSAHWIEKLSGHVPAAPVLDVAAALDNPFVEEVEMIQSMPHPHTEQPLRMLASPIRINGQRAAPIAAPSLGANDAEFDQETE